MVSLKDISKACGVSMTQVSRAINDKDDVSQKTKELVLKTAKELGYVKNIAAQQLATKQAKQLALFHKGIGNKNKFSGKSLVDILGGMNAYVTTKGWEPVLHLIDNIEMSYEDYCKQRNIPGVIVSGMKIDDKRFIELLNSDFPCVAIDIPIEGENKGCVVINNTFYATRAVEELIKSGCKNIGMLAGHDHASVSVERKSGYLMALTKHGVDYNPEYVVNAGFKYELAYEKTKELISEHPEIDGIFCHSDAMAIACVKSLQEQGIKVPDQVAVFGFDDIIISEFMTPPISSISQDNEKKGYMAAKMLFEIIHKSITEKTYVIPCDVVIRESSLKK